MPHSAILTVLAQVPRGQVASYGQIARIAGYPRHARLVGRILRELPPQSSIPWFRILNADGRISERPGDDRASAQRALLESEAIQFDERGRVDLARFGWKM